MAGLTSTPDSGNIWTKFLDLFKTSTTDQMGQPVMGANGQQERKFDFQDKILPGLLAVNTLLHPNSGVLTNYQANRQANKDQAFKDWNQQLQKDQYVPLTQEQWNSLPAQYKSYYTPGKTYLKSDLMNLMNPALQSNTYTKLTQEMYDKLPSYYQGVLQVGGTYPTNTLLDLVTPQKTTNSSGHQMTPNDLKILTGLKQDSAQDQFSGWETYYKSADDYRAALLKNKAALVQMMGAPRFNDLWKEAQSMTFGPSKGGLFGWGASADTTGSNWQPGYEGKIESILRGHKSQSDLIATKVVNGKVLYVSATGQLYSTRQEAINDKPNLKQ